jgi:fucose permease
LILGRLAASQVPSLTEYGGWFIGVASLVAALLVGWMAWTRSARVAWLLVFVVGLLTAPFFPTIVGITFAKYRPEVYGTVFGLIFAGALFGGATVPKAIGNFSQGSSVQKGMMLLVPLCLILVVLVLALGML